jgi:hypothetical protein
LPNWENPLLNTKINNGYLPNNQILAKLGKFLIEHKITPTVVDAVNSPLLRKELVLEFRR